MIAALAGGLVLFGAGWLLRPASVPSDPPVRKVDLSTPRFEPALGQMPVISPDGTRVAYVSEDRLRVRELGRFENLEIPDTDQVLYPSWSPDSSHLVYVRQGRAWKVPSAGGRSTELGAVPDDLLGSGGSTWTRDGRIVIAGSSSVGLWEIPAAGGEGREVLAVDRGQESDFHEVGLLPEDRGVFFTVHRRESGESDTAALLTGGSRRVVLQIPGESLRYPVYSPSGHLVYERETTNPGIWALAFSLEQLETTGSPFLVVPGGKAPSIAVDGTLCFVRPDDTPVELVRLSRNGSVEDVAPLSGTSMPVIYFNPGTGFRAGLGLALSPDGSQVAIVIGDPGGRLWIYDLARDSLATLADDVLGLTRPVWGSRGQQLLYSSSQNARTWNLSSRRADAAAESERLAPSDEVQSPLALSPDGRWLVYNEGGGAGQDLFKMPLDGSGEVGPVFPSRVQGSGASFSPDGRWLAYEQAESGTPDIYVRRFPEGEGRWQVSTTGGQSPVWRQSGEIFYWGDGGLHAVAVETRGDSLEVSKPTLLFRVGGDTRLTPAFDVTPDGQQFFMLRTSGWPQISLVFNWPRELARIAAENSSETP